MLPLLVHWIACGWIGLGSGSAGTGIDPVFEYVQAGYWTITTLATVGYGDIHPQTIAQMLYACLIMMVASAFRLCLGNRATLLLRLDGERERYLTKVDRAGRSCPIIGLPNRCGSRSATITAICGKAVMATMIVPC